LHDLITLTPSEFARFQAFIYEHTGIRTADGKVTLLSNRIRRRLRDLGVPTFAAYYDLLVSGRVTGELEKFIDAITTNETHFFRSPEHLAWFAGPWLDEVTAAAAARQRERSLAVWSAASSTGEEAYSLAICLVEQGPMSFFYVTFSSRAADGRIFMTWNYPFSYGMHLLPNMVANRVDEDLAAEELASEHQSFLEKSNLADADLSERQLHELRPEFEKDLRLQLEHNIARGILARDGQELIRYSVRGWFFLWGQFLREFVKFG
jgi:hypothetical protein